MFVLVVSLGSVCSHAQTHCAEVSTAAASGEQVKVCVCVWLTCSKSNSSPSLSPSLPPSLSHSSPSITPDHSLQDLLSYSDPLKVGGGGRAVLLAVDTGILAYLLYNYLSLSLSLSAVVQTSRRIS